MGGTARVTAVGLITGAGQAAEIVEGEEEGGGLDAVWLAREFLRDVDFPLQVRTGRRILVLRGLGWLMCFFLVAADGSRAGCGRSARGAVRTGVVAHAS